MFTLLENFEVDRSIPKREYNKLSPSEIIYKILLILKYIIIYLEMILLILSNSYLYLNFEVLPAAYGNRFPDRNDMRLVKLCAFALFSSYNLTTKSGKH